MVESDLNREKAEQSGGSEVSKGDKEVGFRRELSFSGWCDENGVFHSHQLENEDANVDDFKFELPLVQQSRSKNGFLEKDRQAFGKFKQIMEGVHIRDASRHSIGNGNENYLPFDIESGSGNDQIYSDTEDSHPSNHEASQKTSRAVVSVADVLKTLFFILVWYTFSTFLTLYNKTLLGDDMGKFPAPLMMNTVHFAMQAVLSKAITWFWSHRFQPTVIMSWRDYFVRVVPTALSTAMDVNLSNASLVFISVTFATMCKSASPIFLLIFAFAFRLESPSLKLFGIMLIISVGILLTVAKETEFEFWGFIFVMLAAVMSGFRWTMTQILLQVLTEYILVSVTSAVTVTIAGVVKEAVTILVAVFYFHDDFTFLKGVGLVTIMVGVSLFNWYKYLRLQKGDITEGEMRGSPTESAAAKYVILEEMDDQLDGP
ncbi:probable sugar phosphate/phosphate translocator At1g06470 isoform X2 [Coffea arabica]|uniref:Probable sugar phosphate/phosphate translocator At1g06470 isoform X2 n=1 Tax=Coffea arabica TaxID=13443 RepID=A0A6P6S5B0_COFAR|nr:probable sugar phosphate/phosphate translocator At1g06470 isoform X2 [Coffea arabica]